MCFLLKKVDCLGLIYPVGRPDVHDSCIISCRSDNVNVINVFIWMTGLACRQASGRSHPLKWEYWLWFKVAKECADFALCNEVNRKDLNFELICLDVTFPWRISCWSGKRVICCSSSLLKTVTSPVALWTSYAQCLKFHQIFYVL